MTLLLFAGCLTVAYGVPLALFLKVISAKAQLVIVTICSAFFWLIAAMTAAIIWFMVPPLKSNPNWYIPMAVLVQEAYRLVFYRLYERAERSFSVVSTNAVAFPLSDLMSSTAAGLGFGVVQSLLIYGTLLSHSKGPGTLFSADCSQMSVFVLSAWLSFCFVIMHVCMMIIAFDAYRRASPINMAIVFAMHLFASMLTLSNRNEDGCVATLTVELLLTCAYVVMMVFFIHRPGYRSKVH